MHSPLTRIIGLILLTCCVSESFAQSGDPDLPERFSVSGGLPDPTINCLAQDEDGFLWIGTFNGLSRFDGTEFVNFFHQQNHNSIPGNDITGLRCLSGHRLLVATSSGLCLCNTVDMSCRNLLIPCTNTMFPYENFFQGGLVLDDRSMIWTGTRTSVYQLDTNLNILRRFRGWDEKALNHSRFIYSQGIRSLGKGRIILQLQRDLSYANFLFDYHSGTSLIPVENASSSLSDYPPLSGSLGNCYFEGGDTWFVKNGVDSLYFFDHVTSKIRASKIESAIPPFQLERLRFLGVSENNAYIALASGGLLAVSGSTSRILLPNEEVHNVLTDRDGIVWIGSNNGLYRYRANNNHRQVVHFDFVNGKTGHPESNGRILVTSKGLFNCTDGGGFYYKPAGSGGWQNILWKDLPHSDEIWCVRPVGGDTIRVATQEGVYWWRPGTNRHGPVHWPAALKIIDSVPVTTQFMDHVGWVWMGLGRGHGVATWNPATGGYRYFHSGTNSGDLPMRHATVVAEDEDNNMWMGAQDGAGLVEWVRNKDSFRLFTPQYNGDFDNGVIYDLLPDQEGHIWIGTAGGLQVLDIHSGRFRKYNTADGLSSNIVYCLTYDREHRRLYVGTKNGPDRLDLATGLITSIRRQYGLPEDVVASLYYDPTTKMIYCNTEHDLYTFPAVAEDIRQAPLHIQLTGIRISGKPAAIHSDPDLDLQDNITVYFTAVNLANGTQNNYFYRLNSTGVWIPLGHQRQVNLSNLASGHYTLYVKAQTYEGQTSINQAALSFVVPVPFRRSPLFIGLILLPVLLFLYLLYRYRISQILRMQRVRNNIATDLHDDIGSSLTNINILAELSHSQIQNPQKAAAFLERISEEVTLSGQSLDDIVWSINARNDSFEEMAARMRRYTAEVLDAANIDSTLHMDERLGHRKLPMELRRDLYLIFREAINNIHKHAAATTVAIDLRTVKNHIQLSIADNGRGFSAGPNLHRNGLKNIRSRAEKWNGSCHWDTHPGKGTRLLIVLQTSPSFK